MRSSSQPRGSQRAPGTWPAAKRRSDRRRASAAAGRRQQRGQLGRRELATRSRASATAARPARRDPGQRQPGRRPGRGAAGHGEDVGKPICRYHERSPPPARCRRSRRPRCRCARPPCRRRAGPPARRASTRSRGCGRARTPRGCARRSGRPSPRSRRAISAGSSATARNRTPSSAASRAANASAAARPSADGSGSSTRSAPRSSSSPASSQPDVPLRRLTTLGSRMRWSTRAPMMLRVRPGAVDDHGGVRALAHDVVDAQRQLAARARCGRRGCRSAGTPRACACRG